MICLYFVLAHSLRDDLLTSNVEQLAANIVHEPRQTRVMATPLTQASCRGTALLPCVLIRCTLLAVPIYLGLLQLLHV